MFKIIVLVIKLRRLGWAWHVVCTGDAIKEYNILVGNPESSRPLSTSMRIWKDNIKINV
jgi:hypothetical protein